MKKFFVSAFMALSCVFASAQVIIPVQKGENLLQKSSEKIVVNNKKANSLSPRKLASLENTEKWGYYLGDLSDGELYIGGAGDAATYYVGYFVPGDGILKGSSINGINVPLIPTGNMTNVSVWISEDLETNLVTKSVSDASLVDGFNTVALDEPFKIPETGIYVGTKFTIKEVEYQEDAYPVIFEETATPEYQSLIMKAVTAKTTYDWSDYSDYWGGHYIMQLFCSDLALPERSAYFKSATSMTSLASAEVSVPAVIGSDGSEGVKSIDYVVEINGNKTSKHLDLAVPVAGGIGKTGSVTLTFNAPASYGAYTANISIEKVNGNSNAASANVLSVTNKVVTKIATRRTVVEEFTGTGCGWCPRGWAGMENMKETKENFIGIAFHQFNSSDPMYVAEYYSTSALGISGAPGCAMDRRLFGIDPYYGTGYSILDDFDYCNAILPEVDVTVSGKFNADYTAVDITANVEYLTEGDKYTVAYVLTADGLKGTDSAWRQQNYYASYTPADAGAEGDPLIEQFCKGGTRGQSSILLTFNDVMIGSSYNANGANLALGLAGDVKAGSKATGTYTVKMPTKAALKNAINNDEVYAVALVIASDGTIANAARAKVTYDDGTGIEDVVSDANAKEVARYNAAGQLISAPQKGLNIIKLSNGNTVKVLVK